MDKPGRRSYSASGCTQPCGCCGCDSHIDYPVLVQRRHRATYSSHHTYSENSSTKRTDVGKSDTFQQSALRILYLESASSGLASTCSPVHSLSSFSRTSWSCQARPSSRSSRMTRRCSRFQAVCDPRAMPMVYSLDVRPSVCRMPLLRQLPHHLNSAMFVPLGLPSYSLSSTVRLIFPTIDATQAINFDTPVAWDHREKFFELTLYTRLPCQDACLDGTRPDEPLLTNLTSKIISSEYLVHLQSSAKSKAESMMSL